MESSTTYKICKNTSRIILFQLFTVRKWTWGSTWRYLSFVLNFLCALARKRNVLAILYSVPCDNYYIYIFPLKRSVVGFFVAFLIFWIAYDTRKEPSRLISLVGLFIYILIGFLFSKHRDQVNN